MHSLAQGSFEVEMKPQAEPVTSDGVSLGRMSLEKAFTGDLQATGKGEMLTALTPVKGSAGYVAIVNRTKHLCHGRSARLLGLRAPPVPPRELAFRGLSVPALPAPQYHPQPPIHGEATSSSVEKSTWKISLVVTEPRASFLSWMSCCASGNPAGITIVPPVFNW